MNCIICQKTISAKFFVVCCEICYYYAADYYVRNIELGDGRLFSIIYDYGTISLTYDVVENTKWFHQILASNIDKDQNNFWFFYKKEDLLPKINSLLLLL
jgi:prepilin signal peptidase PulO-like enzyme (type II secretory pathway)